MVFVCHRGSSANHCWCEVFVSVHKIYVLIGSEVYAIVTYLLSETQTMAIVTPAQGSRKRKHIKCPRKNVTSFKSICSEVSQYIHLYIWLKLFKNLYMVWTCSEGTHFEFICLICRTLDEWLEGQQGSKNPSNMGCSKKVGIVHYSMHWIIDLFSSLCWFSVLSDLPPGCCCFLWHIS